MQIFFERTPDGASVGISGPGSRRRLSVPVPVDCSYLSGARDRLSYACVDQRDAHEWVATCTWERDGFRLRIEDTWREDDDVVALTRRLVASGLVPDGAIGVRLQLTLLLPTAEAASPRFCCPGMVYSPRQHEEPRAYLFADERLSSPLVLGWAEKDGDAVTLARTSLAVYDDAPTRAPGQSDYLHRTDIGSVGFVADPAQPRLVACWPYLEADASARLDAAGTPAGAFHPIGPDGLDVTVSYEIGRGPASTFADAVAAAFDRARRVNPPEPARLPFPLGHAVDLRLASLARTYVEWPPGGVNSTWGTGVTDIYSLFFLDVFVRLSRLTGDPLYEAVADLAAPGCQQLLSHEGERFGFADTGMQPEGIAFCDQGVDDHLIAKGDTWGGLGWIYSAGTYGLNRYLEAKAASGARSRNAVSWP